MTTPGGVPNLPAGALTLENLASKVQDMSTSAMRERAVAQTPAIFDSSTGGNGASDLTPFGVLTKLFAGFNSHVANADPADINGPEDLPGLLLDFIEELPLVGELVGFLEAILGTYDGDDRVLQDVQKFFGLFRDLFGLLPDFNLDDLPTPAEVWQAVVTNFIQPLIDLVGAIGDGLNAILSPIFNGIDFTALPSPEEVWATVTGALIKPLNIFSIPTDVQASIGVAINHTKAALEGTYSGADPIFLAVKNAAAQWLTGSSSLNAGKLTGTVADGLTPGLGAVRDAIYQALNGGSTTGVTAAQVKSSLTTTQTTVTNAATNVQGAIDAGINALRNTPGAVGQAFEDFEDALAAVPTAIFNKFGGNAAPRASLAQADAAMQTMQGTVNAHTAAISALQSILDGAGGFSSSVMFRQPETTSYITAGSFSYTPPSWFTLGVDYIDGAVLGGGGGAQGSNFGTPGAGGTDGDPSTLVVNGTTHTGAAGQAYGSPIARGLGPGPLTYLDILYPGGGHRDTGGAAGNAPGGGGVSVQAVGVKGGGPGTWDAFSVIPTSATITGTVGDGGARGGGLNPGGPGAPGVVHVRARPVMPATFTSMGTLILPTFKLNTGVAQSDAMTAAASWSRVPPNGASGGHIVIIRGNAALTTYVYLRVWYVGGVTHWALGQVTSGVAATQWKTGSLAEAIPFNAFSVTSDDAWTFTVRVNGSGFDSYSDVAHTSSMGALYRTFAWASSDSALPGSIVQFVALDSGTPARITSASVATSQGTASTTYTDLATTGPSVTLDVPASGEIVVDISAWLQVSVGQTGYMGFALSGSNTLAATDARAAGGRNASTTAIIGTISRRVHLTGLSPGTTTVKAVYRVSASGTPAFSDRNIIVEPKP